MLAASQLSVWLSTQLEPSLADPVREESCNGKVSREFRLVWAERQQREEFWPRQQREELNKETEKRALHKQVTSQRRVTACDRSHLQGSQS